MSDSWTVVKVLDRVWRVSSHGERVAEISFNDQHAMRVLVHFEGLPKFNWSWDYSTQDEALAGACAYVRGVERAVRVHAEETRGQKRTA